MKNILTTRPALISVLFFVILSFSSCSDNDLPFAFIFPGGALALLVGSIAIGIVVGIKNMLFKKKEDNNITVYESPFVIILIIIVGYIILNMIYKSI
jgi:hypothetical protein